MPHDLAMTTASATSRSVAVIGGERDEPVVRVARHGWQLLQRPCAQWWNCHVHAEDPIVNPGDDAVVGEAVDGVNEA